MGGFCFFFYLPFFFGLGFNIIILVNDIRFGGHVLGLSNAHRNNLHCNRRYTNKIELYCNILHSISDISQGNGQKQTLCCLVDFVYDKALIQIVAKRRDQSD